MAAQKKDRITRDVAEDGHQLPDGPEKPVAGESIAAFPIVGIGASAGGLGAFRKFFSVMPADSGIAFILIPHLDPSHPSLMVELLGRQTSMQVRQAHDKESVKPNTVYIIPPNCSLTLNQGQICLDASSNSPGFEISLDAFFRSLAADQQERAIGIVLSGTGSHGVAGLKEIKAAGGMVMAQSPESAEFDQMPRSAIDTGLVDYILAPEKMPDSLITYVGQPYLRSSDTTPFAEDSATQIAPILELLRGYSRYDFRCYRNKMLVRRIQRRMGICQITDVSRYVVWLREHPDEIKALYGDLLIGVTSFFRDAEAFVVLQDEVIPDLVKRQSGDTPLRVWVPACSTGEEAYSIAILILEQFAAAKKPVNLQVFASDIDDESLGWPGVASMPRANLVN